MTRLPAGPTRDPEGDQARQRQRDIERHIRKWKARETGALTDPARKQARRKVRAWQAALRQHLDEHPDLKRLRYREQLGAGQTPVGDTVAAGDLEPRQERPISEWSDDELTLGMQAAIEAEDFDRFEAIEAESTKREETQRRRDERRRRDRERRQARREERDRAKWAQYDRLLSAGLAEEEAVEQVFGVSVDRQRRQEAIRALRQSGYTGRGFDELTRHSYHDQVSEAYVAAEDATRGHMLTREGENRGIDPWQLWAGNEAFARRYASEELKNWWDRNGRLTFAEWRAQLLGDPGTVRRLRGERRDFLT